MASGRWCPQSITRDARLPRGTFPRNAAPPVPFSQTAFFIREGDPAQSCFFQRVSLMCDISTASLEKLRRPDVQTNELIEWLGKALQRRSLNVITVRSHFAPVELHCRIAGAASPFLRLCDAPGRLEQSLCRKNNFTPRHGTYEGAEGT